MHLQKLTLLNFKNYVEVIVDFNPRVNLLVGKNGSGKTNLLDSIYYLSFTKSAFSPDMQCIRTGENFLMIKGVFKTNNEQSELVASLQPGYKKVFRRNQQDYERLSDHIGKYPAVLIAPDDTELITEGSELRRKFFDGIIAQIDSRYLEDLMQYNQVLRQRNALLKMMYEAGRPDIVALEAYDVLLVKYGDYIHQKRKEFVAEFVPIFMSFFTMIVDEPEEPQIRYASALLTTDFLQGLHEARQKDIVLQRSNFGIHRDDFEFELKGGDVKRRGSQGQQKSFVIALKLAQYEVIEKHNGYKPVLLLDDILDKLDDVRIDALMTLIKNRLGQIFITDARPHRTSEILDNIGIQASRFQVENGQITKAN